MIHIRKLIPSCVLALALPVAALAQPISISTTPSGSFTNSAGAAMAKVITEKTNIRAVIQAQAMQGQVPVDAGTADFGLSNSFDVSFYVTGTGEYQGQGEHKNIRLIASLTPYRVAMHVRATRNTGATPEDVKEALLHVAIYAGVPAANHAIRVARAAYAEIGVEI